MIIAAITLVFPVLATTVLFVLIGLGMLVLGVGRIITGVTARQPKGRFKVLFVLSGGVVVFFSIVTVFSPIFGVHAYAYFMSITFMLIGLISLVSGIIHVSDPVGNTPLLAAWRLSLACRKFKPFTGNPETEPEK